MIDFASIPAPILDGKPVNAWQVHLGKHLTSVLDEKRPKRPIQRFAGPNVVIFSSAEFPPIPGKDPPEIEKTPAKGEDLGGGGHKETIKGPSVKSMLNLSRLLSSLDWAANGRCLHVTLTYWKTWPKTKAELAAEKSWLTERLALFGCGVWRLEFQTRAGQGIKKPGPDSLLLWAMVLKLSGLSLAGLWQYVAHWHVLLWLGDRDEEVVEEGIRKIWAGCHRWPNKDVHGVMITPGDQGRASWYLAMHSAKLTQAPKVEVGRVWGYIDRAQVIGAQRLNLQGIPTRREMIWWARIYRRSTGNRVRTQGKGISTGPMGFSWFLPLYWENRVNRLVCELSHKLVCELQPEKENPF